MLFMIIVAMLLSLRALQAFNVSLDIDLGVSMMLSVYNILQVRHMSEDMSYGSCDYNMMTIYATICL